jgi:hypothetical protein
MLEGINYNNMRKNTFKYRQRRKKTIMGMVGVLTFYSNRKIRKEDKMDCKKSGLPF